MRRRPIHIHIHVGDAAAPAQKAKPSEKEIASLYADLILRLEWAAARAQGGTADEDAGHKFHGNQWVKVATGPKPTEAKAKSSRGKLKELLSSGHPFTKEELMKLAGLDNPGTFNTMMAFLKSAKPQHAGEGAINIVKQPDGTYQVMFPSGEIVPPVSTEAVEQAIDAIEKAKEAPAAAPPAPAPTPAPTQAPPPPPAPEPKDSKAPIEKKTKAQADKDYNAAIKGHLDALTLAAEEEVDPGAVKKAILKFKQGKAQAMADWAAATGSGSPGLSPATQTQVFAADSQLFADLANGAQPGQAYYDWNKNTALEKAGKFPPKPQATPAPSPAPAAAKVDMGTVKPVKPKAYEDLIPKDFQELSAEDFTSGAWAKGIASAKSKLQALGTEAIKNKQKIEKALRARLQGGAFEKLRGICSNLPAEGMGSLESKLIAQWAASSGDGDQLSCALQAATREAFSIPKGDVEEGALTSLDVGDEKNYANSLAFLAQKADATVHVPVFKEALKEFVHAQYAETQEILKAQGIDEIHLARGMTLKPTWETGEKPDTLKLQPASSFSTSYSTARSFAGSSGTVFLTKVPREQVLSCFHSGFGCTHEDEVVVLAHKNTRAYAVPKISATGHQQAAAYVVENMKKKGGK